MLVSITITVQPAKMCSFIPLLAQGLPTPFFFWNQQTLGHLKARLKVPNTEFLDLLNRYVFYLVQETETRETPSLFSPFLLKTLFLPSLNPSLTYSSTWTFSGADLSQTLRSLHFFFHEENHSILLRPSLHFLI